MNAFLPFHITWPGHALLYRKAFVHKHFILNTAEVINTNVELLRRPRNNFVDHRSITKKWINTDSKITDNCYHLMKHCGIVNSYQNGQPSYPLAFKEFCFDQLLNSGTRQRLVLRNCEFWNCCSASDTQWSNAMKWWCNGENDEKAWWVSLRDAHYDRMHAYLLVLLAV